MQPHGTAVAAMAVGKTLGVAKNAEFIGVKMLGDSLRTDPDDLVDCWNWIVDDVMAKDRRGKAVIVMSYGRYSPTRFWSISLLLIYFKPFTTPGLLITTATWITVIGISTLLKNPTISFRSSGTHGKIKLSQSSPAGITPESLWAISVLNGTEDGTTRLSRSLVWTNSAEEASSIRI